MIGSQHGLRREQSDQVGKGKAGLMVTDPLGSYPARHIVQAIVASVDASLNTFESLRRVVHLSGARVHTAARGGGALRSSIGSGDGLVGAQGLPQLPGSHEDHLDAIYDRIREIAARIE